MRGIKDILLNQPHQAFVQLWYRLRQDFPFFQQAERRSIDNAAEHELCVRRVVDVLYENESLKSRNLDETYPLALLVALDRYLQPERAWFCGRSRRLFDRQQTRGHCKLR